MAWMVWTPLDGLGGVSQLGILIEIYAFLSRGVTIQTIQTIQTIDLKVRL